MSPLNLSFSKTLNPHPLPTPIASKSSPKTLLRSPKLQPFHPISSQFISFPYKTPTFPRLDIRAFAGRSKKPSTDSDDSTGRNNDRKDRKRSLSRKTKQFAESFFYRLKNPHKIHADNFTQDELQMIGLGYDRFVRFMAPDDPNLKHPYDWYKYGEYGPYSWRGIVIGDPIRGTVADDRVTMIGDVRDQEEWEQIEMHEMGIDFSKRLEEMNQSKDFRYFWVFVRHPKWRISELPWQQWTLVCEVVLEAEKTQRLDKWNLMARLGSKARSMVTQCAAWMRPDIIYVKKPVYQCRFEPQDKFFDVLRPFLDPETEQEYLFELRNDGKVQYCTYYGGLCRIVNVSQKAFVDDVVKGYMKLSDEKKSKCLEFLLKNHPIQLLHPYTKEWKAKLEEEELGCDAPDDDDGGKNSDSDEIMDWIEDDSEGGGDEEEIIETNTEEEEEEDMEIIDAEAANDAEEDEDYWEKEFSKAIRTNEGMEQLAKKAVERADDRFEKKRTNQTTSVAIKTVKSVVEDDGDELEMRGKKAKVTPEEWKRAGYGPFRRKVQKSKAPPGQFLRAAVRPFSYRNLVKEIVLMRHAIVEGEIDMSN